MNTNMTHADVLARLDSTCGDMAFQFGLTASCGNADCLVLLTVDRDEAGSACYRGIIRGRAIAGCDLDGLGWQVIDPTGFPIARGTVDRRGRFQFPLDHSTVCACDQRRR